MKNTLLFLILFVSCKHQPATKEDASVWNKIKMDFRRFDNDGLAGPPGGKISANYEFCIPASDKYLNQVKKIDKTAQKAGGKGRVRCSDKEWMVIGATHQPKFQRVLYELASLPFVKEIQETFYE